MDSAPRSPQRKTLWSDRIEKPVELLIRLAGWSAIATLAAIFLFILKESAPMLARLDYVEFFTENNWRPNPAAGNVAHYGALGLIAGTFATTLVALAIAVPFGLAAAVYLSEFASGRVKETLKIVIELLAAIPSIVWGVIGLTVIGPWVQSTFGANQPGSLLVGGLVLGLMSVPLIVSLSEDALRAVPDSYREAALALGASKWEIVWRVLFPAAKTGLLASVMLGLGRAIGETMAALLATGNTRIIPTALTDPVATITAAIAAEMNDTAHGDDHYRMLFVLGLFLFIITAIINVVADLVIKGRGARHH
jgi:phosphate transport system permease protein